MVTINQVKTEFDKMNCFYLEELTSGNYTDDGKIIKENIQTLTTKFCEIGFYKSTVYFVFIAKSDSWSEEFYKEIKNKNVQVYGFKKFKNNYSLSKNPETEIKSETNFQIQFTYDVSNMTVDDVLCKYTFIVETIKKNKISIVNQLNK